MITSIHNPCRKAARTRSRMSQSTPDKTPTSRANCTDMLTATAVADAPASLNQETKEEAGQAFIQERGI
jgi:hypothetical protein